MLGKDISNNDGYKDRLCFHLIHGCIIISIKTPAADVGRGRQWYHWNRKKKTHLLTAHTTLSDASKATGVWKSNLTFFDTTSGRRWRPRPPMVSLEPPCKDAFVDALIVQIGPSWDRQDYFDPPDIDPFLKVKSLQINTHIVIFACKNYIKKLI